MPHRLTRASVVAAAVLAAGHAGAHPEDEPADDDIDHELQSLQEEESKLQVYGFADFTYTRLLMDESSRWYDTYFSVYPTFAIGNLNLYVEKAIAPGWGSLIEFRLLYLPNGSEEVSETGQVTRTDTTVLDYQDKTESLRWGGVSVERAWVEYHAHPLLTVRAGQWLTPYGIWNVDHGSPVLLSARRPFVISMAMFPRSQTGFEIYGSRTFGDRMLTYHVTLSNGRGPVDTYQDLDHNKAVGGRLVFEAPWFDEFKVGASTYTGTYSARTRSYGLKNEQVVAEDVLTEHYRELAVGGDLRVRSGPLRLDAEFLSRQVVYADRARPPDTSVPIAQQADYHAYGGYVMVGVRLPWYGVMPYILGEYVHPSWGTTPSIWTSQVGLNIRAAPSVTIKLQLQRAWFPGLRSPILPDEPITALDTQVAWVF